jgi:hypothetical protein
VSISAKTTAGTKHIHLRLILIVSPSGTQATQIEAAYISAVFREIFSVKAVKSVSLLLCGLRWVGGERDFPYTGWFPDLTRFAAAL